MPLFKFNQDAAILPSFVADGEVAQTTPYSECGVAFLLDEVAVAMAAECSVTTYAVEVYGRTSGVAECDTVFPRLSIAGDVLVPARIVAMVAFHELRVSGSMQIDSQASMPTFRIDGSVLVGNVVDCEVSTNPLSVDGWLTETPTTHGAVSMPILFAAGSVVKSIEHELSCAATFPCLTASGVVVTWSGQQYGEDVVLSYVENRRLL